MGIAGILPGAGKMFKSFLHPEKGYEKGQEQLNQYYNQGQQYLQPYNQNGQEAYGKLNGAVDNLLDPSSLFDKWINDYQQSDVADFNQERARQNGLNSASSMGLMGSSPALQSLQAGQNEIGAQDQMNYIEKMIQQYLSGAGLAQSIYGQGANAAGAQSNNANQMGQNSAQMAYGKQNAPGQMFNDLLKTGAYAYSGGGANPGGATWSTTGGR